MNGMNGMSTTSKPCSKLRKTDSVHCNLLLDTCLHLGDFSAKFAKQLTKYVGVNQTSNLFSAARILHNPLDNNLDNNNNTLDINQVWFQAPEEWTNSDQIQQCLQLMMREPGAQRWQARIGTSRKADEVARMKSNKKSSASGTVNTPWMGVKTMVVSNSSAHLKNVPDEWLTLIGSPKFSQLTSLDLSFCRKVTDTGIVRLAKECPQLIELNLHYCHSLDNQSVIAVAQNCPMLKSLNLSIGILTNELDDESITALANCKQLTNLNLSNCEEITDASVTKVAQSCTSLTNLNLYGCEKLTDASVIAVSQNCPELKVLSLENCPAITDASITLIAQGCMQLTVLSLSWCQEITSTSVVKIAQCCPKLVNLNLEDCNHINDESLIAVAYGCTRLTHLNIGGCNNITDTSVVAIAQQCNRLVNLNLESSAPARITGESIISVAQHCTLLTALNISNINITDAVVINLAERCKQMKEIHLNGCTQLTDAGIIAVVTSCNQLTILFAESCINISSESLMAIAEHCNTQLIYLSVGMREERDQPQILSKASVIAVLQQCTQLKTFGLSACWETYEQFTQEERNELKEKYKQVNIGWYGGNAVGGVGNIH